MNPAGYVLIALLTNCTNIGRDGTLGILRDIQLKKAPGSFKLSRAHICTGHVRWCSFKQCAELLLVCFKVFHVLRNVYIV